MEIGELISTTLDWIQNLILGPPTAFRMHMDADRDGAVDNDWLGLESWTWGANQKGVIILCNNDDDQGANATDHSDNQVNAGNDRDELAPLVIRRTGRAAPATMQAFLEVAATDRQHIRIFDQRAAGGAEVLGPSTTHRFQLPDLNFQEKEFGIEATRYAGTGFTGTVFLTFTVEDSGAVVHTQRALLRVAPWIMPNHLDAAERPSREAYRVAAPAWVGARHGAAPGLCRRRPG